MEILKEMGQRLSELRIQRQMKQKDMAELLDVTLRHYQRIEHGLVNIPTLTLVALADYFGVSTDYLLGRSDQR